MDVYQTWTHTQQAQKDLQEAAHAAATSSPPTAAGRATAALAAASSARMGALMMDPFLLGATTWASLMAEGVCGRLRLPMASTGTALEASQLALDSGGASEGTSPSDRSRLPGCRASGGRASSASACSLPAKVANGDGGGVRCSSCG